MIGTELTRTTQSCLSSTNRPTEIRIGGVSYLYWHKLSPLKSSERVWSSVKEAYAHLLFDVHFFQHLRNKKRHFKRNSSPQNKCWHHLFMSFQSLLYSFFRETLKENSRVKYPFKVELKYFECFPFSRNYLGELIERDTHVSVSVSLLDGSVCNASKLLIRNIHPHHHSQHLEQKNESESYLVFTLFSSVL